MKGSKYSKLMRPGSWNGMIRSRKGQIGGVWAKLDHSVLSVIMLAGISGLIVMLCRIACHGSSSFLPNTPDWDKQRAMWRDQNPTLRPQEGERPRVLMVSGSSPKPCESNVSSHAILRAAKNKLDYCRLHDIQLFYSLGNPNPIPESSADWWVTLPIIRMLMFQHPEVEWMWWVDADAVFTDMSLEPPFADFKDHNLVLFREDRKDDTGLHTGNYLIRNCQWSLDLIQAWGSTTSEKKSKFNHLSSASDFVPEEKSENTFDAHKSAVATSLIVSQTVAGGVVKETENWMVIAPNLEFLQVRQQQQQVHGKLPLVTHFAGCMPCSTARPGDHAQVSTPQPEQQQQQEDVCLQQLDRTFDFADNQVYDRYGFERRALGSSKMQSLTKSAAMVAGGSRKDAKEDKELEEFSMLPRISDWDEQRHARREKSAVSSQGEKAVLVSGSAPKPCIRYLGDQMLIRGLKNKIDYCRLHGMEIFYNMAVVDNVLTGWWSKLPLLRMLMLNNPEVEWFWWIDSDAVVTDMDFEIPFESRYSGYNLVMYGREDLLYEEKDFVAINTGSFFMRNCQWSIDLLDRWASWATSDEDITKNGEILTNFLKRPWKWDADDQSVLVYLLITERERWASKVFLEATEVDMSGNWEYWTPRFLDDVPLRNKPFVTHFAGCTPCGPKVTDKCLTEMDRAFHFADNQVLESAGLCHENLRSSKLSSSCSIKPEAIA